MKKSKITIVITLCLTIIILLGKIVAGKNLNAENNTGFAVVELFTSEGCSSCPPADAVVAKLQKESRKQDVYILAFHVDYWNHLGWKDVFSNSDFSKRQRQYASWLRLQTVYTPQIVVNGRQEFVGSEEGILRNAIKSNLQKASSAKIILSNVNTDHQYVNFKYKVEAPLINNVSLILAIVKKEAQTKVQGGENEGHTLSHVQIVRDLKTIALDGKYSGVQNIKLPTDFNVAGFEIIAFLQNQTNGSIIAATQAIL